MLNFVLQTPSLQHLAGVKIAAALWNERDIYKQDEEKWTEIEEKVKRSVSALPLTEPCKKQLVHLIEPLGKEIHRYWRPYHTVEGTVLYPRQFCWTMHGTVDYVKTARSMLKDERLDIEIRYEIASINCLEDEARQLFESMGKEGRQEYFSKQRGRMRKEHLGIHLPTFFNNTLKFLNGNVDYLIRHSHSGGHQMNSSLFRYTLFNGDGGMCEYWFAKLSQREKVQVLEDSLVHRFSVVQSPASCLLYYLSRMNEKQRERMFRKCISAVLVGLLRWPMQSLFIEAAKCGWPFLVKESCALVLNAIVVRISSNNYYDYSQWCWGLTTAEYKQHFLNCTYRLERLFLTKRVEFIRLCLNRAHSHQLKELVENSYDTISCVLMDERVISEAALMKCKQKAALISSSEPQNEEKRLRSEHLSQFVDLVMESREKV